MHEVVLQVWSSDDAHSHTHGGETILLWRVREEVRPEWREEEARQGAPEAEKQEGRQDGRDDEQSAESEFTTPSPPPPPPSPTTHSDVRGQHDHARGDDVTVVCDRARALAPSVIVVPHTYVALSLVASIRWGPNVQ